MIRINLLPQAKKGGKGATGSAVSVDNPQVWIAIYVIAAVLACVACAIAWWQADSELNEQRVKNERLTAEIAEKQAASEKLAEIEAALDRSKKLEQVADELQRARLGPTRVLMEISKILSSGGGPTVDEAALQQLRRENPLAGFNAGWDSRRLWITKFEEVQRACVISGVGKSNDDVAELIRRLSLSKTFEEVQLTKTEADKDGQQTLFELTCKVRY